MKNNRPIILNCFSRGGSNILWNILLSHPEVCSPIQETLQIFRLDWRGIRKEGLKAALLGHQWRLFDQWNLHGRAPISSRAQEFIDQTLFYWKLKTLQDSDMRYKSKDKVYSLAEVENSRLVLKNNNGTIFLSGVFFEMYPDAIFFGLVRDPIPLYESHKRNRTPVSSSPERFASFYQDMVGKMLSDANRFSSYQLVYFEDMLKDPLGATKSVYDFAGLDMNKVPQMRFKAKPHMQADGSHSTNFQSGKHYWLERDEIPQLLEAEVNQYQVSRLESKEVDIIRALTQNVREQLGYPL